MGSFITRIWQIFVSHPECPKQADALRFGILGAARVAPMGLLNPAKSHPEVVIQSVAARDRKKAEEFAKTHGIPDVKDTYEDVINDPNIDCIYIPLANSLHFEWTIKAIRAGKHVLIEKPSVSNSQEASILFNLPELSRPNAPVVLEGFHFQFFPSWQLFRSLINPKDIEHVHSESMLPGWMIKDDDISFNYTLAGGSMMNLGTYHFAALRLLFAAEPEECLTCNTENFKQEGKQKIDYNFHTTFRFSGGGIGEAKTMMRGKSTFKTDFTTVRLREEVIADPNLSSAQEKVRSRTLKLWGMFHGVVWHRIDIIDTYTIRDIKTLKITKTWTEKSIRKAYTFKEAGGEFARFKGEDSWMSFRHQLEQFVNRVKGRETQYWVGREDSIRQMKMVDLAYEKSGLGARQTSKFALEL